MRKLFYFILICILSCISKRYKNGKDQTCFIIKETGDIIYNSNFYLNGRTTEVDLRKALIISSSSLLNGYNKLYADSLLIGGIVFQSEFIFKGSKLEIVNLNMKNEPYQIPRVWPDYKETDIEAKKRKFDIWLNQCLLGRRNFDWGKVETYVEPQMWNTFIRWQFNQ